MASKTTSIRLSERMFEDIDKKCEELECCRNDFIKSVIETALEDNSQEKSIPEIRNAVIVKLDNEEFKPHYDRHGNYWYYDYQRKVWVCKVDPKNIRT